VDPVDPVSADGGSGSTSESRNRLVGFSSREADAKNRAPLSRKAGKEISPVSESVNPS
jgi:hypothetical protein